VHSLSRTTHRVRKVWPINSGDRKGEWWGLSNGFHLLVMGWSLWDDRYNYSDSPA